MKGPHRALRFDDVAGQKFSFLTAVWPAGRKNRAAIWFCICECGGITYRRTAELRRKNREISCGCRVGTPIHGMKGTSEYNSYQDAKRRCTNPKHHAWKDYGGRGIRFELPPFKEFYEYIGPRPPGLELDRIDNDGNYKLTNIRWATKSQQAFNRRKRKTCRRQA